MANAKYVIYVK